VVLYYLPEPTLVFFRCRNVQGWNTTSIVLEGAGILNNALTCHVTTGNLQLYAQISGEIKVRTQSPAIIIPSRQTVTSHSEMESLRSIVAEQTTYKLLSKLSVDKLEPSVENLLHLHTTLATNTNSLSWTTNIIIPATVSICMITLYHCSHALWNKIHKLVVRRKSRCSDHNTSPKDGESTPQQTSNPVPVQAEAKATRSVNTTPQHVVYAIHDTTS